MKTEIMPKGLSLRIRLSLVFSLLMMAAILCCALVLIQYHNLAVKGSRNTVSAHNELVSAVELRENLSEVDRRARLGDFDAVGIAHFRKQMFDLEHRITSNEGRNLFPSIREKSELYFATLGATQKRKLGPQLGSITRIRFEDAAASIASFIGLNENTVYRIASQLRYQQERSMKTALICLSAFILLIVAAGYIIISVITKPLTSFARFLDQVDVEDDLPTSLPRSEVKSQIPEIQLVARSFNQLLSRLRGYRNLNVRRLLLEKRRADIIAASISDGMFLLRGEDIIYLNPIAEKILGDRFSSRGPSLSGGHSLRDVDTAGSRSVLAAISRTIPVEFCVEDEDRKYHYQIQTYPIPVDLIERCESTIPDSIEHFIDKFQANTLVVARDVTLAAESQEAKSHFLATLSHEVKTPVTSLTMATRLLAKVADQFPNATHRSLIQTCASDVDRLRGLLEDLLTVSRFDTLAQRLELQAIDISKLIKHSLDSFRVQAVERGVDMTLHMLRPRTMIRVDPTKISWALSNLLLNALRHTPRGGKVEVSVESDNSGIEVRVRDSGPGIDRKRQSKIFDKFNPFYDIRVARTGGAGIGLAVAREIVVAHGGRIWVSSEPGNGAEFCFTLPVKRVENTHVPEVTQVMTEEMKGTVNGASARS